jgi:hypothetical protein
MEFTKYTSHAKNKRTRSTAVRFKCSVVIFIIGTSVNLIISLYLGREQVVTHFARLTRAD